MRSIANKRIKKVQGWEACETGDDLAIEEPLEILLKYGPKEAQIEQVVSVTMRTPGDDENLSLGFLFTEGIIRHGSQVDGTGSNGLNRFEVSLRQDAVPVLHKAERNFYTTSSCGVCGKTSIDAIHTASIYNTGVGGNSISANTLYELSAALREKQAIFKATGGLHAAALFDIDGKFQYLKEDVGRHNALDKLIGAAFLANNLPLHDKILLLSGRASFELVQKAAMAGIGLVAAVGAPSSLAVELAEDIGITLVGFLRERSFNVYSGDRRILIEKPNI